MSPSKCVRIHWWCWLTSLWMTRSRSRVRSVRWPRALSTIMKESLTWRNCFSTNFHTRYAPHFTMQETAQASRRVGLHCLGHDCFTILGELHIQHYARHGESSLRPWHWRWWGEFQNHYEVWRRDQFSWKQSTSKAVLPVHSLNVTLC